MSENVVEYVVEERHHSYGPSRWPALTVCSHYVGKPGGADAAKGVRLHELFAHAAKGLVPQDPEEEEKGDLFERNAVALGRMVLEMAGGDPGNVMAEETVTCPPPRGVRDSFAEGEIFGRFDVAWLGGDEEHLELHVGDLKMVENPDRDYRPQLVAYAWGLAKRMGVRPETAHLHPMYVDTRTIKHEVMDWDELAKAYKFLRGKVYAASLPSSITDTPVQSGWCQLCAKFETCPACMAVAEKVGSEGSALAKAAEPVTWASLVPARKAQMCVLAETAAKWADAVKKAAAADAKAGVEICDPENGIYYGLQERKGTLALDTDKCWEAAKTRNIGREEFVACLRLDAKAFKTLLTANGMKGKEADALLESCGTRGAGSTSFVRKGVK